MAETLRERFFAWMNEKQNPNQTVSYTPSNYEIAVWIENELTAEKHEQDLQIRIMANTIDTYERTIVELKKQIKSLSNTNFGDDGFGD